MQPTKVWSIVALVVVVGICGLGGGGLGAYLYGWGSTAATTPDIPVTTPERVVRVVPEEDAIIEAIQRASPAIVKIVSEQKGIGSGFVFEHEGDKLILTNAHVVGGADRLTVSLASGAEFEAEKLGVHPDYDIAVIKPIKPPANLTALPLGDSESVRVGQRVIALGNPFGFDNTATMGIVSAITNRRIKGQDRYVIQTDASINQGNSGGPLVDLGGNAIGINYAIFSPTATNLGIGFAIPINQAKAMMYFLVNRGPWIGLAKTMPNSPGFARWAGLATDKGVVVLLAHGPLAEGGVQRGDVILVADGQPVTNSEEVERIVLSHRIGETIRFNIQRDTQQLEVSVQAGTIPEGYY